jgi:3-hydroxy-9,10-secoandrosta-1,3,5(10)-triene-9,17-dione monooxygenase
MGIVSRCFGGDLGENGNMASAVAVSRADDMPSGEVLVRRARAMVPVLRERAQACVAARDVPAESIAEFQEAGFFRILQPRRWGGYEMHPNVFYDVQKALAEGCMSTGWMYGVVGCHPYEIALFHEEAQAEVWGEDQSTLVSSSYQPVGKVTVVDGGFRLSGRWGFSTGSVHCKWVVLGALVPPSEPGGAPDMRAFLLPRSDYTIDTDSWHVFGLQGTGLTVRSMASCARTPARKRTRAHSTPCRGRRCSCARSRRRPSAALARRSMPPSRLPRAVFRPTPARPRRTIRS